MLLRNFLAFLLVILFFVNADPALADDLYFPSAVAVNSMEPYQTSSLVGGYACLAKGNLRVAILSLIPNPAKLGASNLRFTRGGSELEMKMASRILTMSPSGFHFIGANKFLPILDSYNIKGLGLVTITNPSQVKIVRSPGGGVLPEQLTAIAMTIFKKVNPLDTVIAQMINVRYIFAGVPKINLIIEVDSNGTPSVACRNLRSVNHDLDTASIPVYVRDSIKKAARQADGDLSSPLGQAFLQAVGVTLAAATTPITALAELGSYVINFFTGLIANAARSFT
jgi:hypothetical protein